MSEYGKTLDDLATMFADIGKAKEITAEGIMAEREREQAEKERQRKSLFGLSNEFDGEDDLDALEARINAELKAAKRGEKIPPKQDQNDIIEIELKPPEVEVVEYTPQIPSCSVYITIEGAVEVKGYACVTSSENGCVSFTGGTVKGGGMLVVNEAALSVFGAIANSKYSNVTIYCNEAIRKRLKQIMDPNTDGIPPETKARAAAAKRIANITLSPEEAPKVLYDTGKALVKLFR